MARRGPEDASPGRAPEGVRRFGARRRALLEAIRSAPDGLGIKDLAAATGVHENTVRFHLDRLLDEGVVESRPGHSGGPGRRPLVFHAHSDHPRENYELIARVLIGQLVEQADERDEDPADLAREAGRTWGREWGEPGALPQGWTAALDRLGRALAATGFAPEVESAVEDETARVRVNHCPFLALAQEDQAVPCGVHLGLMEGVLEGAGQSADVRLEPFATERTCLALVTRHGPSA